MENELSQFSIRLSKSLRDHLHAEARRNNRSLNAEISHRLSMTLQNEHLLSDLERPVSHRDSYSTNAYMSEKEVSVVLKQVSRKIDGLQNYIDSEKFSARLFKQAFAYFSKK